MGDVFGDKQKESFCFEENLIQSLCVLDYTIVFSAGLSTYLYDMEDR